MFKVSVIIPNYNHAPYLKQRIDSVLSQTFQDFELIILDDCSTDNSREIIELYRSSPKISNIVYNEINSGSTFKQWKKGVELAIGEYIWIAESDDYADANFLFTMIALMEKEKEIGMAYCNSTIINENGDTKGLYSDLANKWFSTDKWNNDYIIEGCEELKTNLLTTCTIINVSPVLFRADSLKNVIEMISLFRYAGDWLVYMLIALRKKIYYSSLTLNYYRDHPLNTTKQSGKNYGSYYDRYYARLFFFAYLKEYFINESERKKMIAAAKYFLNIELRPLISLTVKGKLSVTVLLRIVNDYMQIVWFNKAVDQISIYYDEK